MSGYDALRAMRKGDGTDPEFEEWKNNIVKPEPIPISDTQHQMHIDLTNDDLFEDDGTMDMNGSIFPTLREIKESGDKDLYNLAAEQGSTDIFEFDDDPPERIGTPYPDRETTQTTIDAHAAGGDNVWQRGQTARQQAAMARDAQQARDLARPYRMAPKVAYKQAQEEQNMEPTGATKKSAMPELPSISSMIKGKRENPRENLAEFQKGLPVQTELSRAAAVWNRGKGSEYTGLKFPEENQKSTDQQNPMTTDQRINTVWDGVTNVTRHRGYDVSPASKDKDKDKDEDEDVKKSIANEDTAGYLHEKYKPYPGYISERRNEREGPHQPSIQSAIDALTSQQAEDQRIRAERQDTSEAGWDRGGQEAQAIIDQYKGKIPDEEIIEMLRKLQDHATPTDFRPTEEGLSPDEQYSRAMNYLGYVEHMDGKYNDFFAGDRTGGPGEDPVVSAVRNNVHHQESLRNNRDERLDMGRSYGVGHRRSWFERDSEKEKKEKSEQTDSSTESTESAKKSEGMHFATWEEIKKSVQKYPDELPPISSMIKGKRENPRENLFEFKKRDTRLDKDREHAAAHNNAGDLKTRKLISQDLRDNDGNRKGVIYDRDRNMYPGSQVGRTPFLGEISDRRDNYIEDMDARSDALWSMDDELYDESDDITDYAKQYGLDPDNLRSFIITLRNHYRDNLRGAEQTKENLSSVTDGGMRDEES